MSVVRYRVPAPGSVWTEEDRVETAVLVQIDGETHPHTRVRTIKRRVEVFGASARLITRARVAYLEHEIVEQLVLSERRHPSPIHGKTFVLDATAGGLTVTGPGGEPVAPDEEQAVRAVERWFGRTDSLPMVLAQLEFRAGEAVSVPPAMAARLFGGEQEVTRLELTFVEHRGDAACFTVALGLTHTRAGATTHTTAAGTLDVETDTAQLCEMQLVGTVAVTGATSADGTVSMVRVRTPAPAGN